MAQIFLTENGCDGERGLVPDKGPLGELDRGGTGPPEDIFFAARA
jgi:hypothetical protein